MARPTGQWVRMEVYFAGQEKQWSNVFWYTVSGGSIASPYDLYAATNDLFTSMLSALQGIMLTTYTIRGCYCVFNDGVGSFGIDDYTGGSGLVSGTKVPEDLAIVVQKISALYTSDGRGRWYFSGFPATFVNGSYLAIASNTPLATLITALLTPVVSGGVTFNPAVFSNTLSALNNVISINPIALLGTQRKRRTRF